MKITKMYFPVVLQTLPFFPGAAVPSWGLSQDFCLYMATSPSPLAWSTIWDKVLTSAQGKLPQEMVPDHARALWQR